MCPSVDELAFYLKEVNERNVLGENIFSCWIACFRSDLSSLNTFA